MDSQRLAGVARVGVSGLSPEPEDRERVCRVPSGTGCSVQIPVERAGQTSFCSSPTVFLPELKGGKRTKEQLRGKSGSSQRP